MAVLFGTFFGAVAIGIPMVFAFGIAGLIFVSWSGLLPPAIVIQRMAGGLESWPLLAMPFFMLMGDIFMQGGMGVRLLNLVAALVGCLPGGLAVVCVIVNMFMAGVSGSSVADASAIGAVLIPEMKRKGYPADFIVALHSCSAVIGIIIPPSIPMIVYAFITESSVRAMFLGGIIPGIMIGLALMVPTVWTSWREGYPRESWPGWLEFKRQLGPNIWAFLAPVIVLGGILSGVVTTTESAVLGTLYVLAVELCVYRTLSSVQLVGIFANAAKMVAAALLVLATASAYGTILTAMRFGDELGVWLSGLVQHPALLTLAIIAWYLIQGCFIDLLPGMLLTVPIFLPLVVRAGMDPVHFGVMTTIVLGIGLFTPPVGTVLFTTCAIGGTSMESVTRRLIPFMIAMLVVLLLVAFIPSLSLWLARMV